MNRVDRRLAIAGSRNTSPLSQPEVTRVINTFLGLDASVQPVTYEAGARTVFRIISAEVSDTGEEYGEIVFGEDIYPGTGLANPNAALTMRAAVAHEASHFHRWLNKTQLDDPELEYLDEALTSLEAVQRYGHQLDYTEITQLIADAHFRLSSVIEA